VRSSKSHLLCLTLELTQPTIEPASTAQSSDTQTPDWKSKPTLVDKSTYQKVFKENPVGNVKTIRVKKSAPKQTKPGNWKESEIIGMFT